LLSLLIFQGLSTTKIKALNNMNLSIRRVERKEEGVKFVEKACRGGRRVSTAQSSVAEKVRRRKKGVNSKE